MSGFYDYKTSFFWTLFERKFLPIFESEIETPKIPENQRSHEDTRNKTIWLFGHFKHWDGEACGFPVNISVNVQLNPGTQTPNISICLAATQSWLLFRPYPGSIHPNLAVGLKRQKKGFIVENLIFNWKYERQSHNFFWRKKSSGFFPLKKMLRLAFIFPIKRQVLYEESYFCCLVDLQRNLAVLNLFKV